MLGAVAGGSSPAIAAQCTTAGSCNPGDTASQPALCNPLWANPAGTTGYICGATAAIGVTGYGYAQCNAAGMLGRGIVVSGSNTFQCLPMNDPIAGDYIANVPLVPTTGPAASWPARLCAGHGLGVETVNNAYRCTGTATIQVQDAAAGQKLDALRTAGATPAPSSSATPAVAAVVLDGSQWGMLFPLLLGGFSLLLVLAAIRTVAGRLAP